MKAEQFIVDEVTKHLRECARKNKYQAIDAVQGMREKEQIPSY